MRTKNGRAIADAPKDLGCVGQGGWRGGGGGGGVAGRKGDVP